MKLSIRLAALAITAVALAGPLAAQQHHDRGRSQGRGYGGASPRQAAPVQHYAQVRGGMRGGGAYQPRGGNGYAAPRGNAWGARGGVGERGAYRVPVAEHGRPLITRGYGAYGRPAYYGERGFRDSRGFFIRADLPFGWERRVIFGGFFPLAYAGYCEAVPYDYEYLLPPMAPSYDPCLFGDRVIVFDRFSRSIVFVATL